MKKLRFIYLIILMACGILSTTPSYAVVVNTIDPTLGLLDFDVWGNPYGTTPPDPPGPPGSVGTVDLSTAGGTLQNVPAGTGALRLETTGSSSSRAEARIQSNLGSVGSFVNDGSLSYSYYHSSGGPSTTVAPALKLGVINFAATGTSTFIYEPIYNTGPIAFDQWNTATIDPDTALFWHFSSSGGMTTNGNGGILLNTFAGWNSFFGGNFLNSIMFSISLGLGSGTPNELGYVDNLNFSSLGPGNTAIEIAADFESLEVAAVPLPAALPLYGTGIALLGLMGWRKRRNRS